MGDGAGVGCGVAWGPGVGVGSGVGSGVGVGVGVVAATGEAVGAGEMRTFWGSPGRVSRTARMMAGMAATATTVATAVPRRGLGRRARGARKARARAPTISPMRMGRRAGCQLAISRRFRSSSFPRMLEMWYLTVYGLMPSFMAISALVAPERASSSTRHSAGVRTSGWGGRPRPRRVMGQA